MPRDIRVALREALTISAAILAALLAVAFAAPWLINWTAERPYVDAALTQALGVQVSTTGDIDLKLLPTPSLAIDGFRIETGFESVRGGKTRLELQVMPLARGEFRFYEVDIESPEIEIRKSPVQRLGPVPEVRFDHLRITNGRVTVLNADGSAALDAIGIDIDGEADSISGPFRGAGVFTRKREPVPFRFATGAVENQRMRLKLVADEKAGLPKIDFDGSANFEDLQNPVLDGQVAFSAIKPDHWRLSGPLHASVAGMRMEKFEARLDANSSDAGPVAAVQGDALLVLVPAPRLALDLTARQLDIDRIRTSPVVATFRDYIGDFLSGVASATAVDASLASPTAELGGETLTGLSARMLFAPGSPPNFTASIDAGPGGSQLALTGKVEMGAAARFFGHVEVGAHDLRRLADWTRQWTPLESQRLQQLPFRGFGAQGDFSISAAGFSAENLVLKADRTILTGSAAFTRAIGANRPRIYGDFSSEAFDLETVPDLAVPVAVLAGADLAISLNARAIRVARFGDGAIDAGRIQFRLRRDGAVTSLDNLSIADLGGAMVEANGKADSNGASLKGVISAERLGDLATFLRQIAPSAASDALAARATALSPAKLAFSIEAKQSLQGSNFSISALSVKGTARGTIIEGQLKPDGEGPAMSGLIVLDSDNASLLARQIGLNANPDTSSDHARIEATAHGDSAKGYEITGSGVLGGKAQSAVLTFRGNATSADAFAGKIALEANDCAPLLRLSGYGLPDVKATLPVKLAAEVNSTGDHVSVHSLMGTISGDAISGDLFLARIPGPAPRFDWTGALQLGNLSLPVLAQIILGPVRTPKPGETWTTTPFAAGMAHMPGADINVSVAAFHLSDTTIGNSTQFQLRLSPGGLEIADLAGEISGGLLSGGRLSLRRDGANVSLTAAAALDDILIAAPGLNGLLSGVFDMTASGESMAALVSGLSGEGRVHASNLIVPRADPAAPARVLKRADVGDLFISENDFLGALRNELDAAPYIGGDKDFAAVIAGGNVKLNTDDGLSLSYDLKSGIAESRVLLTIAQLPQDWDGPAPKLSVAWKGKLADPRREIDAGSFNSALTARAVAKEQARIEAFEADIQERAAFNRRQKALNFIQRRDDEIAAWEAEQVRLAREEEKRKLAEADRQEKERRAADAARKAADALSNAESAPAPLDIGPLTRPAAAAPTTPAPGSDPSAAGRY